MENENLTSKMKLLEIDLLETINREELFSNNDFNKKYIKKDINQKENNIDSNNETIKQNNFIHIKENQENEVIKKATTENFTNIKHKKIKSNNLPSFNKEKNILTNTNFIDTKLNQYKPKYKNNVNTNINIPSTQFNNNKNLKNEKSIQNNNSNIKLKHTFDKNKKKEFNIPINKRKESYDMKNPIIERQKNNKKKILPELNINKPFNQINKNDLSNSNLTFKNKSPKTPKFNRSFNENIITQNNVLTYENTFEPLYEYNIQEDNNNKEYNNKTKYYNQNNIREVDYSSNSNYTMENTFINKNKFFNNNNQNVYNINQYYQSNQNNFLNNNSKKILKKSQSSDKIFQINNKSQKYNNVKSNLIIDDKYIQRIEYNRNKKNNENIEKRKQKEYEELKECTFKPKINKTNYKNNFYNLYNKKEDNVQMNYFMIMKKKNEYESMNYNNQQKQQFFNERNIKINQPKIRTKNFN
jgi:hypothetical protein